MKFSALIFDFNGVLWWDTEIQENAWQKTAKLLRGEEFSLEELELHLHGRTNRHTLEYLLGKPIDTAEELYTLTQIKETCYREKCLEQGENFTLSPGAIELLNYLKEKNIPITIATASEITNLTFFFEHLRLSEWFSFDTIIYDNHIRPGKPAPDIYLDAAKILDMDPGNCVVVEDAVSGMKAAHTANIWYLIALGPLEKYEKLSQIEWVNNTITKLSEIIQFDLF